jgi:methylated-DNA-protein-cysteine methyltransferase-like protein
MKSLSLNEKHKDFFQQVFEVVKLIPKGRVTSYGAIARYLSSASASRMVGWAMNTSHTHENVPAHRVVNRNGLLTGKAHFSPPSLMEELLKAEGIEVREDKIVDFEKYYWDPTEELKL